jgi:hypothetical protein
VGATDLILLSKTDHPTLFLCSITTQQVTVLISINRYALLIEPILEVGGALFPAPIPLPVKCSAGLEDKVRRISSIGVC